MKYIVLIPTYDPSGKLKELLSLINKKYETVIVDDGSKDKSIFDSISNNAHIISYKDNMGKGYALKKGFEYINNNYKDYIIVTMDDDMQHDLSDAIKLCDYVNNHDDELALGRRHWDKSTPFSNRMGNKITRFIFKKKTGLNIYDTQSGLRAFSYKLIDYMLNVEGNRYEYEMNVLLNLKNKNIKYKEINIKTIYHIEKTTHYKKIKDSYRIYKEIIKYKNN